MTHGDFRKLPNLGRRDDVTRGKEFDQRDQDIEGA
jgi:hypothetical protein